MKCVLIKQNKKESRMCVDVICYTRKMTYRQVKSQSNKKNITFTMIIDILTALRATHQLEACRAQTIALSCSRDCLIVHCRKSSSTQERQVQLTIRSALTLNDDLSTTFVVFKTCCCYMSPALRACAYMQFY